MPRHLHRNHKRQHANPHDEARPPKHQFVDFHLRAILPLARENAAWIATGHKGEREMLLLARRLIQATSNQQQATNYLASDN
jgi:hypothetical protein